MFDKLQGKIKQLRKENQDLEDRILSILSRSRLFMTGTDAKDALKIEFENLIRNTERNLWVMTRYVDSHFAELLIMVAERLQNSVTIIINERNQIPRFDGQQGFDTLNVNAHASPVLNDGVNGTIVVSDDSNIIVYTGNLHSEELVKNYGVGWKIDSDENMGSRTKKYLNELLPSFMQK